MIVDNKAVANKVRSLIVGKGLQHNKIAASIGYTPEYLSMIIHRHRTSLVAEQAIADALGLSYEDVWVVSPANKAEAA